jgi:hypothetical protein
MVGVYFGGDSKGSELVLGATDTTKYNTLDYFNAYDYNGLWEISMNSIGYKLKKSQVYEQRALIAINLPFLMIPYSSPCN